MILVIGGVKGGTGKTTLATNLAVMRAEAGKKVLLVDADEQRSASEWANQRASFLRMHDFPTICLSGSNVYIQIIKMKPDYDDIIVDTGGRDTKSQRSALSIADVSLFPFKPRSIDIWTIGTVNEMIDEARTFNDQMRCFAVINQADPVGKDNETALSILQECQDITCIPVFIVNRKAFPNAASDGMAVTELTSSDSKAAADMTSLYNAIYN